MRCAYVYNYNKTNPKHPPPNPPQNPQGIEVQAAPLELLASRRQQFQRRMSRHWLRLQEEAGLGGAEGGVPGPLLLYYVYIFINEA